MLLKKPDVSQRGLISRLARSTFGMIRKATQEIQQQGSFEYARQQIPDSELCEFFSNT
jgi:hypothetical protein